MIRRIRRPRVRGSNFSAQFRTMVTFDRNIIKRNWSRINRTPLTKAGNLIRFIMRSSIKRRKLGGRPGPAGEPPRSRRPGKTPPFKMIFSVPNYSGTSVTIGMVGFGSRNPVPGLHEHGGMARRYVWTSVRRRRGRIEKAPGARRVRRMIRYPKRPFAVPARDKALPLLPPMWNNSLSR